MTIDGHWESLLMEAMRLADEAGGVIHETAAEAVGPAPAQQVVPIEPPADQRPPHAERVTEEILLCSATGEVLYEWQSPGVEERARLLEALANKSGAVGRALSLGPTQRIVVESADRRVIALLGPEHNILLRVGVRQ
jgi:hypothetical protein